jgi:hypothetical protein
MQLNKGFDVREEGEEGEAEEVCQEEAEMEDFLAGDEEPHDGIDLLSSSVEFEDSSSSSYHPPSPLLCDPQPPVIREPQKKRQKRVVAQPVKPPQPQQRQVHKRSKKKSASRVKQVVFKGDAFSAKWT